MEKNDKIKGGKADKLSIEDIAKKHSVFLGTIKKELEMGMKVEKEHTHDDETAKEIAMDHLTEFPDYYTRLDKMEKDAKKKTEAKESMGADASGSYEAPFSTNEKNETVILKKDIHNWKTSKEQEVKEITGSAVSAGAMYDAPPKGLGSKDPLKIDNPGKAKTGTITASKEGKGYKDKAMKYMPGSKFVDVKKQCKIGGLGNGKSKACNQGDQGNLVFYENKEIARAIHEAASKYGLPIEEVTNLVIESLPKSWFDDPSNEKALRGWVDKGPKPTYKLKIPEPIEIVTKDDVDIARLKVVLRKYDINFDVEEIEN